MHMHLGSSGVCNEAERSCLLPFSELGSDQIQSLLIVEAEPPIFPTEWFLLEWFWTRYIFKRYK